MGQVGNVLLPLPNLGKAFRGCLNLLSFAQSTGFEVGTGGHKSRDVTRGPSRVPSQQLRCAGATSNYQVYRILE